MYYQPTPISWQNYHFLIMSAPGNDSMKKCIKVSLPYPSSPVSQALSLYRT